MEAYETFIYVNGHLIMRSGNTLETKVGNTIYLDDNTPLLVEKVEIFNGIQTIHATSCNK